MRALVFLLLTVFFVGPAQADQAQSDQTRADLTKREKIAEILKAQHFQDELLAYAATARELIVADARRSLGPGFDEQATETLFDELRKSLKKHLEGYVADLIEVYSEIFSDEEVDAAFGFYTSEMGRSISEKWPRYSKEHARLDAVWLQRVVDEALKETRKAMEE